jgi:Ca2+-binding EF-hand superfamily protein
MDETSRKDEIRVASAFANADADGSGSLDVSELPSFFATLGTKLTQAQCHGIVSEADIDRSGKLSLQEVKALFVVAKLRAVFDDIDNDKSGSIQASELSGALEKLGYELSQAQCRQLLMKLDADQSGEVSFDEFRQFFRYVPMASIASVAEHLSMDKLESAGSLERKICSRVATPRSSMTVLRRNINGIGGDGAGGLQVVGRSN